MYCATVKEIGRTGGKAGQIKVGYREGDRDNGWIEIDDTIRLCEEVKGHRCGKLPVRMLGAELDVGIEEMEESRNRNYKRKWIVPGEIRVVKNTGKKVKILRSEGFVIVTMTVEGKVEYYAEEEIR